MKRINCKLVLKRETVRTLANADLTRAQGARGPQATVDSCAPCLGGPGETAATCMPSYDWT